MSKTELVAIILAVNGGLWLLLALIDWIAVRLNRRRHDIPAGHPHHDVPTAHAH